MKLLLAFSIATCVLAPSANAAPMHLSSLSWPPKWVGSNKVECQWSHFFLAHDPKAWTPLKGRSYGEDSYVSYFWWGFPHGLPEGTKILIEGDFPYARFMNFQVTPPWDPEFPNWRTGEGAPEISLLDEDIVPDLGHVNPFLPGADRHAKKRRYHVTFELRSGNPVTNNPQAGVPPYRAPGNTRIGGHRSGKDGTLGTYVWYRIYAPDRFHPSGGVALPVVRIQRPGEESALAPPIASLWSNERQDAKYRVTPYAQEDNPCQNDGVTVKDRELADKRSKLVREAFAGSKPVAGRPLSTVRRFTQPDGRLIYFKMFGHPRLSCVNTRPRAVARLLCPRLDAWRYNRGHDRSPPGNDEHTNGYNVHNTYLSGGAQLDSGQALVIRAKAPKAPVTLEGNPVMDASYDLRYWSLCVNYGRPAIITVDCIFDEHVVRNSAGYYTLVISREQDRPRNARPECGISWLPWRISGYGVLVWRYQSTSASVWQHAPQRVTWERGDASLATYDEDAIKNVMEAYYPATRYSEKAEVEKLGCAVENSGRS